VKRSTALPASETRSAVILEVYTNLVSRVAATVVAQGSVAGGTMAGVSDNPALQVQKDHLAWIGGDGKNEIKREGTGRSCGASWERNARRGEHAVSQGFLPSTGGFYW